jgi:hypothetical protein
MGSLTPNVFLIGGNRRPAAPAPFEMDQGGGPGLWMGGATRAGGFGLFGDNSNPAGDGGFFIGLTALPIFVALDPGHGRRQKQQHENTADDLKYHHENDPCEPVGAKKDPAISEAKSRV